MILILRNSDSSVVVEKSVVLNVYDPIYTSVEEYMRRLDTEAGHVISLSYYEKKGYHLPSVFVTGGEEAASILVAKYPVSQEAVLATSVEETLDNLSKPFRSRVRVYKDSKSADNTGSEGGELHKLINPNALVSVLNNIKTGKLLNGNAHPVLNSASLDTMLANMTDAGYLANNKLELKPLNPTEDLTNSTSEYSLKLTGAKYQLNLTAIRSEDHSFTTVEETKDPFYSQGAIWNTGRKHFEITNNTIAESTRGTILGEMQSEAYETLNKSKVLAFPIVSSSSFNTHNGEANGIVDMFGAGIKVYSDLVYTYEAGIDKLKILDPYTTKVEYDSTTYATRENDFATIAFNENSFMANTDNVSYIGTNENKPDNLITRSVFSNYSYKDFKDGYLMDNVGLPMDNSVMTYPNDVTFKGNAGFVSVPNWQYGRSAYYVDYRQITDNGGTKGYFVTGTVGNGKLLFGNSEEIHNNKLDWAKLYPGNKNIFTGKDSLGFGKATAGNRSRVLLHEGVLYGINKNDRYTDDNLYYNNRLHFLIFDTDRIERNPLVNLSVNNKFIELEETRSATLDITTDGKLSVGVYDKDGISVDLEKLTVTAIKTGTYEFTINSSADNKDTAGSKVYVKVVDLLDPTDLTVDKYDVIGKTDDVITIKVTTNASDISTVMTGAEAVIDSKKKVTADDVTPTIFEVDVRLISVTRPEVSLIISATAPNSKTASIEIPIVISQRIDTKYEVLVKNFAVNTKAELQGTLNTDYLAKKLNLVSSGINLTNLRSVCIWSKQLAGQAWKVNSDYTFSIDFGNSNYSVYTIDFEAQLDQEYEYDGIIPAEKPKAKIENNLNSIVTGTITINVYIGDEAQLRGATLTSNLTDNKAIAGTTYPAAFTSNRPVLVSAEYSVSPSTIATISKVTNVTTTEDQVDIKIADVIENDTSFSLTMTTKYIGNAIEYKTVTINVPSNIQDPAVFEPEEYEVLNDSTVTGTFTVPDHVTVETSVDPDIGDLTVTKE